MAKEYRDQTGQSWERYDNLYCPAPSYHEALPINIKQDIFDHILSRVDTGYNDWYFTVVPLSVFSVPMWPIEISELETNCLHFSYCMCFRCNQFCSGPAQVCLLLLICRYDDETFLFAKRPVIQCIKCNPHIFQDCSYFGFILSAQQLISEPLNYGWDTFDPRVYDPEKCYVCEQYECLNRDQCIEELEYISENGIDGDPRQLPTAEQCMNNLLWHFYNYQLDVISDFIPQVCHNVTCRRLLRNRPSYKCDHCRRVIFCSEKCSARHPPLGGCASYYSLWLGSCN